MCNGTIKLAIEARAESVNQNMLERLGEARKALAEEVKAELRNFGYDDIDTVEEIEPVYGQDGVAKTSEMIACSAIGESRRDINSMLKNLKGIEKNFLERFDDLHDIVQDHALGDFSGITASLGEPFADGEYVFDSDGNPIEDDSDPHDRCIDDEDIPIENDPWSDGMSPDDISEGYGSDPDD